MLKELNYAITENRLLGHIGSRPSQDLIGELSKQFPRAAEKLLEAKEQGSPDYYSVIAQVYGIERHVVKKRIWAWAYGVQT